MIMPWRRSRLKRRTLGMFAATRAMLGAGVGLLVAPQMARRRRKTVGLALLGVGIATTIPLARALFGQRY